jgi:RimJ/RimL family protein N-acetyltransferase
MAIPTTTTAQPDSWQGRLVWLRAIEPADWPVYFAWNQDDELARGVSGRPWFPQTEEAVQEWARQESTQKPDGDGFRFVIVNPDGDVVGDLNTHHCDPRVGAFWYGITIRREHRRHGYASEAITLMLRYYFRELRYQKVTVAVYAFNEPSLRLHEKLGFRVEGRLRRTVFTAGGHHDEILYGLTTEEFDEGDRVMG